MQRIAEINSELTEYRNQLVSTESPYLRLKEAAQNALKTIARGFIGRKAAAKEFFNVNKLALRLSTVFLNSNMFESLYIFHGRE